MKKTKPLPLLLTLLIWVICSITTEAFTPPEWTQQEGARHAEWLNFTSGFGEPGNRPDVAGSNTEGVLTQHVPGGTVTGSGNIYNPAGASAFSLAPESNNVLRLVSLQTEVIGGIDPASVVLEYSRGGENQSLAAQGTEISRASGNFGDIVIEQWTWNVSGMDITDLMLRWNATAPHSSLVGVRLDTLSLAPTSHTEPFAVVFTEPSHDRWSYQFNATPGARAKASVFRSVEEDTGVSRHGTFVVSFDTENMIPAGHAAQQYEIWSAQLKLLTSDNFEAQYDPTYDSVLSHLPEDHTALIADEDGGRPVELFGTGFRGGLDVLSWTETAPFYTEETEEPVAYPVGFDDTGALLDVSLAVDYAAPRDVLPFATGTLAETPAGDLIPRDTWMTFDLDLAFPATTAYLQSGLAQGKLAFTLTSLGGGGQGARVFPEFHTKDSLLGEAPQLSIEGRVINAPDVDTTAPAIKKIEFVDSKVRVHFDHGNSESLGIRWTTDFTTWKSVEEPILEKQADGSMIWTDQTVDTGAQFYQIFVTQEVLPQ